MTPEEKEDIENKESLSGEYERKAASIRKRISTLTKTAEWYEKYAKEYKDYARVKRKRLTEK